ncbi:LOW QUALITY PROTEIN: hypothetical protein ACHAXA_006175 [Cyclostephanos tholiformis]|uniref:Uncharacterized protein n=1 Tax=Cyclostephanos tholiformis TaxID=382380 RepID=A0ABD3R4N9_9STRA
MPLPLLPPLPPHFYLYAATALRAAAVGGGGASSLLLVRSLLRGLWERSAPDWMRIRRVDDDDDGGGDKHGGTTTRMIDDMSSLSEVMLKLEGLIRARHPNWRDDIYRCRRDHDDDRRHNIRRHRRDIDEERLSNIDDDDIRRRGKLGWYNEDDDYDRIPKPNPNINVITPSQIEELSVMLDFAIWAYETNEESLRSYLLASSSSPSGNSKVHGFEKLNGRGGADEGRDDERGGGYNLILHRTTEYVDDDYDDFNANRRKKRRRKPPGRVGFYVAVSHVERTILIGMKGTSTFEDLLTDCCGRAVRVDLDGDPHRGGSGDDTGRSSSPAYDYFGTRVAGDDVERVGNDDNEGRNDAAVYGDACCEIDYEDKGLVDVVRVSAADIECGGDISPNNSVEVELANDGGRNFCHHHPQRDSYLNDSDAPSSSAVVALDSGIDDCDRATTSSFPSSSVPCPSRDRNIERQISPPVIEHSHTNEYMESHGIETEANRSHKLRGVHEGILHCARLLLHEISPIIEDYGGVRRYLHRSQSGGWRRHPTCGITARDVPDTCDNAASLINNKSDDGGSAGTSGGRRVRAFAFAPPPVLDLASSLACRHYVTSIVNNSDIIPRSSLTNLDAFLTILEAVRCRLLDEGTGLPGQMNSIASIISLFFKLCEGTDGEMVLTPADLRMLWDEATSEASLGDGENDKFYWDEEFGHHLYVPGRLLLMYESWSLAPQMAGGVAKEGMAPLEADVAGKASLCSFLPTRDMACGDDVQGWSKDQAHGPDRNGSNGNITNITVEKPAIHAMWTDGTILALRGFEIGAGSGMVTDHLTSSYRQSLNNLPRKIPFQSCRHEYPPY